MNPAVAFDPVASAYDQEWSWSPAGRAQREAVWRELALLFHPGDRIIDLGCGTGEDALWLGQRGVHVAALDPSAEMVRQARKKGADASVGDLADVSGAFDGLLSNFAALNCIPDPAALRPRMAELVKPGGHLALCIFGKFCVWESLWYLLQLDPRRAARRWGSHSRSQSLGIDVYYPTAAAFARALQPEFDLLYTRGIGLFVPPSYVKGLPAAAVGALNALDRRLASLPLVQTFCDHQLLVCVRR